MDLRSLTSTPARRWLATLITGLVVAGVMTTSLQALPADGHASTGPPDGSVTLADTAGGVPMFGGPPMSPGGSRSGCLAVTNQGEAPTRVTLFGRTGGTGLDAHLALTVVRGAASSSTSGACVGFRPDPTDYSGLGDGVVFRGTLRAFPDDAADGLLDPGEAWQPGETHAYRFAVRLERDAPQGLAARQSFVWQTTVP